ncbi:uncharacterized protein VICG_01817 [Vittaforma corneae ATCC 50505]|uniref:PX domain-containing protein n=1 Tax=Vittaforma corneae (strain ATCC 50505) TaxID=993615 RepID=L2GJS6_VITCO|nr:uncharacterized protein VICG_01817 [Vittaforma corneae ATCC 50505]ELA41118.1 hypothetical protein VICG_01817 [Vittaforma corneae ATCC 50505]
MTEKLVFEISIPSTRKVKGHTEYQFILITNMPELSSAYTRTYKRYSEILKLHEKISRAFPKLPEFPGKRWFGKTDPVLIENRRKLFEAYFNYIFEFIAKNNLGGECFAKEVFTFFNK